MGGRAVYHQDGDIISVVTFPEGRDGTYQAKQRNGKTVLLTPLKNGDRTFGFIWAMPEYGQFQCVFKEKKKEKKKVKSAKQVHLRKKSRNFTFYDFGKQSLEDGEFCIC